MANKPSNHPTSKYQIIGISRIRWNYTQTIKTKGLPGLHPCFMMKILFQIVSCSNLLKPPTVCPFLQLTKTHIETHRFPSCFSPILSSAPSSAPHPTDTPGDTSICAARGLRPPFSAFSSRLRLARSRLSSSKVLDISPHSWWVGDLQRPSGISLDKWWIYHSYWYMLDKWICWIYTFNVG